MKIAALDLGDRWIGTAISDASCILARPLKTIEKDTLFVFIEHLLQDEKISEIVIGYPKTLRGTESEQTKKIVLEKEDLENSIEGLESSLEEKIIPQDSKVVKKKSKKRVGLITIAQIPPLHLPLNSFGKQQQMFHRGSKLTSPAGLLTYFPYQLSPARGRVIVLNGALEKKWEEAKNNESNTIVIKRLFGERDGKVAKTHLGGNPVRGLSPFLIGLLVRIIQTEPALLTCLDNDFFMMWYQSYLAVKMPEEQRFLKKYKRFAQSARTFLNSLNCQYVLSDEQGKQDLIDLLLAYLVMEVADQGRMAEEFAKGLGLAFPVIYYSQEDFSTARAFFTKKSLSPNTVKETLESLLFFISEQDEFDLVKFFYADSVDGYLVYQGSVFQACHELSLRKLVNLILYNPKTKKLDIGVLPKEIQHRVLEDFKKFIEVYGNTPNSNKDSTDAFLNLLEKKKEFGLTYEKDDYSMKGGLENTLAALRMLFGIKESSKKVSTTQQFTEIIELLCDKENRQIQIDGMSDTGCLITLKTTDGFVIDGKFNYSDMHVRLQFLAVEAIVTPEIVENLFVAGKILGQFLLGAYPIPMTSMLAELIELEYLEEEDEELLDFFKNYVSSYDKSIPEVFYGDNWREFFSKEPSQTICLSILDAANKMGFDTRAESGFLVELIKWACENKSFFLIDDILKTNLELSTASFKELVMYVSSLSFSQEPIVKNILTGLLDQKLSPEKVHIISQAPSLIVKFFNENGIDIPLKNEGSDSL